MNGSDYDIEYVKTIPVDYVGWYTIGNIPIGKLKGMVLKNIISIQTVFIQKIFTKMFLFIFYWGTHNQQSS